ncbi:MAG: Gfo/Idh/MocA family oxidoreductase [Verrucomicrobia bacterium]|nr:Gfo/Idh/MocA family oxidoreductase [Verrucomicrobiota bacterium]
MKTPTEQSGFSRRQFIKVSSVAAAAAATVSFPSIVSGQSAQKLNAAVIGVGGRGSGAGANFLDAAKIAGADAKIVAVADLFPDAASKAAQTWGVPSEKAFSGFDGYMKALEVPGVNYVILATPPGFRPPYFKAAVAAGKNIFTEKPVCVDGPGARIMYAAAEEAKKKGLKIAAGTQRRHHPGYIETIKRIQDGAIGDVTTLRAYWVNGGPIWHRGVVGDTDLERQIRNWYHYIWLCADHIVEQHVHNIDVCNWVAGAHPVKAWGLGARQQLGDKPGEIWDNFAVEFEYESGVHMHSYCGQVKRDFSSVSEAVVGSKGTANPVGSIKVKGGENWRYAGKNVDPYVQEHVDLITAILKGQEINEAKQVTDSTLTAIMGREAAYSGGVVEWEDILNSEFAYGPEQLYKDASKMTWGAFRTLRPPMPGNHDIFSKPPQVRAV